MTRVLEQSLEAWGTLTTVKAEINITLKPSDKNLLRNKNVAVPEGKDGFYSKVYCV